MLNYYQLLKIPKEASQEEIEVAFAKFKNELLKFSPGINLSEAELRARKPDIWNAYEFLLNPTFRKEYDEALERDRIHELYEAKNKKEEEQAQKTNAKWKYFGLGATIVIVLGYFFQSQISASRLSEKPNWRTHYITDKIKILLPAGVDSSTNIIPIYLTGRSKSNMCYMSELSNGFSVTVARCEMDGKYALSFADVASIGSHEMQNMHIRHKRQDTANVSTTIHNYRTLITKGTFQVDNVIRGYENYTLINGNEVIKVIVNYIPENPVQEKYCEIVFKSLMLN